MSNNTYFKIEQDGSIKKVTTSEMEINIEKSILNRFAADTPLKTNCLMSAAILPDSAGLGNIGMCIKRGSVSFTVRVGTLPMRTPFIMKNGNMVPEFKADGDTEFVMNWVVPDGMRLYFIANFIQMKADVQFLVAVDKAGRNYRLPLSNLYEDARICHGEYTAGGTTPIDLLSKAWLQFHKSRWNSHLTEKAKDIEANSQKLFRFKPLEKDGFEQLKPDEPWESLSTKVATSFIEENLVL